ncbi:hypothetical protein K8R32_03180 [bacterium]|nr:hypothetical protein [bacterium]
MVFIKKSTVIAITNNRGKQLCENCYSPDDIKKVVTYGDLPPGCIFRCDQCGSEYGTT